MKLGAGVQFFPFGGLGFGRGVMGWSPCLFCFCGFWDLFVFFLAAVGLWWGVGSNFALKG